LHYTTSDYRDIPADAYGYGVYSVTIRGDRNLMTKKKVKPVIQDPKVVIKEAKKEYTDAEKIEFGKMMADAIQKINEKAAELKEFSTAIKSQVAEQETILAECAAKISKGYEMDSIMCYVVYGSDGKTATFTNKETGEVVEERELTEEEQLWLTSQWKDAEEVIREDSKEN
jgi:hypothetical protein